MMERRSFVMTFIFWLFGWKVKPKPKVLAVDIENRMLMEGTREALMDDDTGGLEPVPTVFEKFIEPSYVINPDMANDPIGYVDLNRYKR